MDKIVAFDQIQSVTDVAANEAGTNAVNGVVTFRGNIRKKGWGFQGKMCVYGALGGRAEFATISMACNHRLKNKVSFELKSAFRDVAR